MRVAAAVLAGLAGAALAGARALVAAAEKLTDRAGWTEPPPR